MRKTWLIPIIGSIGNLFSVATMLILPALILGAILANIFHLKDAAVPILAALLILSYSILLFYRGASGSGAGKVEKVFGSRQMTLAEKEILSPMIAEVLEKHNSLSGTNWQLEKDLNITISEDDSINAFAFGKKHVIFNTGLLNIADKDIFKAVLAHEIAHLYRKDTLIGLTNYFVQIPTQYVLEQFKKVKLAGHVFNSIKHMGNSAGGKSFDKAMMAMLVKLYFLPALLVGSIVNAICNLVQKALSKQQELAADNYAAKLGYSDGLIAFLKLEEPSDTKNNRLMKLFESHPEPQIRIENIKNYLTSNNSSES